MKNINMMRILKQIIEHSKAIISIGSLVMFLFGIGIFYYLLTYAIDWPGWDAEKLSVSIFCSIIWTAIGSIALSIDEERNARKQQFIDVIKNYVANRKSKTIN